MNPSRDDEYAGLDDLLGSGPNDDRAAGEDTALIDTAPVEQTADTAGGDQAAGRAGGDLWAGLPTELHAEYAEAYRRGYERARRGQDLEGPDQATLPRDTGPEPPVVGQDAEPEQATLRPGAEPEAAAVVGQAAEPTRVIEGRPPLPPTRTAPGSQRPQQNAPTQPVAPSQQTEATQRIDPGALAKLRQSALAASGAAASAVRDWTGRGTADSADANASRDPRLLAAGLGVLALLVIAGAFGLGRLLADTAASSGQDSARIAGGNAHNGPVYDGPLQAATIAGATASCQADHSYDAAGNVVSYEPANAYDGKLATAWRCDGPGRGQRFTISLPKGTVVAQVGLVPGYAKTDPASGADRYAENNRITKVRWRFDDGTTFVQHMSGDPDNRGMRTMRIPETTTRQVVLQILASRPGPRDTIAISELRIASPRD